MIPTGTKGNIESLWQAFSKGDAALVECRRKSDGATVVVLCAVIRDGERVAMKPVAEIVNGNARALYDPPKGASNEA